MTTSIRCRSPTFEPGNLRPVEAQEIEAQEIEAHEMSAVPFAPDGTLSSIHWYGHTRSRTG
jgi:hypothetical protein